MVNEGLVKFTNVIKSVEFVKKMDDMLNIYKLVRDLTDFLLEAAERGNIKSIRVKHNKTINPPWFDNTCTQIKSEIRLLGKLIKTDPNNQIFKIKLSKLKQELKTRVKDNKMCYKKDILQKMEMSKKDSKLFWKYVNKLEEKNDGNNFKEAITEERWLSHFKGITSCKDSEQHFPQNTMNEGELDYEITLDEIKMAAYTLRHGKSPGFDRISNEMLSCLLNVKPEVCKKLFNVILQNPMTINSWEKSMITPIHKKGSKMSPENYRGISLLSCLGKFFTAILNQRLFTFVSKHKILSKGQLGFIPGNRTSDAHLILYNLIESYCKTEKKHVFGCFVDFEKAFDSLPRHKLFKKLLDLNINGKFYDCLISLYTKNESCVKIGNTVTNFFHTTQGVKQGCILSPLLFNIFLSDLQREIEKPENDPAKISQNEILGCILWADDILLVSESETGLQKMLSTLKLYTDNNGMRVNQTKTKVMIFNKNGRHIRKHFTLGGQKIECTRSYKYLGFMVTPSGEIQSGLNDLKDRAQRAFFNVKSKLGPLFQKHPNITLKLFDTLIKPILLYCSDFWGILNLPKNNPIEILQNSIYKQLLGVQKQTTTLGILLELGQIPLSIYAKKMALKNWIRIAKQKTANDLLGKSYKYSITLNFTWPSRVKESLATMGMANTFTNEQTTNEHNKNFNRMCDIFHQNAFAEIKKVDSKLRTYSLIKTKIGLEKYILENKKLTDRINLSKLRLSNHMLNIEKGRHNRIPKENRVCPFCPTIIEDEIHSTTECKLYSHLRRSLYISLNIRIHQFEQLEPREKFITLFSYMDSNIIATYTTQIFELRDFILSKHKNVS